LGTGREAPAAGAGTPLAGPKLPHSIPEPTLNLVHYGHPGLESVSPRESAGSGAYGRTPGLPAGFFLEQGSNLADVGHLISSKGSTPYETTVSGSQIYDSNADPLGYWKENDGKKADQQLIDLGYKGVSVNTYTNGRIVKLFTPVPVRQANLPEAIVAPAIRVDGKDIVEGEHHAAAREAATAQGIVHTPENTEEGFTTTKGRFVPRDVAFKIARDAGQIQTKPKAAVLAPQGPAVPDDTGEFNPKTADILHEHMLVAGKKVPLTEEQLAEARKAQGIDKSKVLAPASPAAEPAPEPTHHDLLKESVGDPAENLRVKLARKEGTGVPENPVVRFHDKQGRPIYIGGDKSVGGKPFDAWIEENQKWMSLQEIKEARVWYDELHDKFIQLYGAEEAPSMMMAWLAAQQNASPTHGLMSVFRVQDRLAGTGVGKKGGLADQKIEGILTEQAPKAGFGPKLSDFVDSGMGRDTRTFMGGDPRGGKPFVADIHSVRDNGHVDGALINRLVKMAYAGNLFVDGKPTKVTVTGTKDVKVKDTVMKVPTSAMVRVAGRKGFTIHTDLAGGVTDAGYENVSEWGNKLSDYLNEKGVDGGGWTPKEAQAVGWMRVMKQYGLPASNVESAVQQNTGRVYAEVTPGSNSPLSTILKDFSKLPVARQAKLTTEIMSDIVPKLAKAIGGSVKVADTTLGDGLFGGASSPSMAIDVLGSPEGVDLFRAALGYVTQLSATMSATFGKGQKRAITIELPEGMRMSPEMVKRMTQATGIPGLSYHPAAKGHRGVIVGTQDAANGDYTPVAFTDAQAEKLKNSLLDWAAKEDIPLDIGTEPVVIGADANDWKDHPKGEGYLEALHRRGIGSALARVDDLRVEYPRLAKAALDREVRRFKQAGSVYVPKFLRGEQRREETGQPPEPPKPPKEAPPAGEQPDDEDRLITSIRNKKVNAERIARGAEPLRRVVRQSNPETWAKAQEIIDGDPGYGARLTEELAKQPRAVSAVEDAILLDERITRSIAYRTAVANVNEAQALGDEGEIARAQLARMAALADLEESELATKGAGTETARGLQARKMLANSDYSLEALTREFKAIFGRDPNGAEQKDIEQTANDIQKGEEEVEKSRKETDDKLAKKRTDKAIDGAKKAKPVKEPKPTTPEERIQKIKDRIGAKLKDSDNDISTDVQKLVRELVESGITDREAIIDAVHAHLKEIDPAITRREAMDAISGYGKYKQLAQDDVSKIVRDLKGQMQQLAKIKDMEAGDAPKKTGMERRTPSYIERMLIKLVNALKKTLGFDVTDPATQLKTAQQAVTTRLTNEIADLDRQIEAGRRDLPKQSILKYTPEMEALREKRDALRKKLDEVAPIAPPTNAERLEALQRTLQKSLEYYSDKLARNDFSPRKKAEPPVRDLKTDQMQANVDRVRKEWRDAMYKETQRNQPRWLKNAVLVPRFVRAGALSSPVTLAKLVMATITNVGLHPLDEMAGSLLRLAAPELMSRAPIEGGGFSLSDSWHALARGIIDGWKDAGDILSKAKGNRSDLDVLYGKGGLPPEALEVFGLLHGAEKAFLKRGLFEYAMAKQAKWAAANGIDFNNPIVQMRMGIEAYKYASRGIFQENNFVNEMFNRAMSVLSQKDPREMRNLGFKLLEAAIRSQLPVTKVGTNLVMQTGERMFGAGYGAIQAEKMKSSGYKNVTPEQADETVRHLKKGIIGGLILALGAAAYLAHKSVGGLYQPGEKRKPGDVKYGEIRFGYKLPKFISETGDIPGYALHNPGLNALQVGATVARLYDALSKNEESSQALGESTFLSLAGLGAEIPFIREAITQIQNYTQPGKGRFLGGTALQLDPQFVQWAAQQLDKDSQGRVVQRSPQNALERLETGIPFLRNQVTTKSAHDAQQKMRQSILRSMRP
jgi:hypothetical protein